GDSSKRAWWRIIGRGRKRAQEDDAANKAASNTQITPTEGKQ
ncbi:hypothetical protein HMPREF1577_00649, partial [Gardnerella pickettii JCP8017A]